MSLLLLSVAAALAGHPGAVGEGSVANIDPACKGEPNYPDYDEVVQRDFLQNYFALVSSFSPLHGPIPHKPGHGAVGLEMSVMPPLSCEKRMALEHTKTEDTNKSPILPRPRIDFAFPKVGVVHPYVGAGYTPPLKVVGTQNVILSIELGFGIPINDFQFGLRYHDTVMKTSAEIATPFVKGQSGYLDFFSARTKGGDLMVGWKFGDFVPYGAFGILDASTNFWVGDDGLFANNLHPYLGPAFSVGLDGLVKERFRFGAEFYGAPGGYSKVRGLDYDYADSVDQASRYGRLYTGRLRLMVEL